MNRKDAIRRYKDTPRASGVYAIRNKADGKVLVGSAVDVAGVLNGQRAQLRFGAHRNRELQLDWNRLGADAFEFEVLDTLTPPEGAADYDPRDDLAVLEALWIERLQPFGERGYHKPPRGA